MDPDLYIEALTGDPVAFDLLMWDMEQDRWRMGLDRD